VKTFVLTLLTVASCLVSSSALAAATPSDGSARITAEGLRADIAAISDDSTQGRTPGTPGDRMTRGYLIRRLEQMGFKPGAEGGGWEQPITFVGLRVKDLDQLRFSGTSSDAAFQWGTEFIGGAEKELPHVDIPATEVVFVGYGIDAPEFGWNDFKNADVNGKILLVLNNDPDWDPKLFAGKKRLYYGRWDYKYATAAKHGAAGVIILHTEDSAGYPWSVVNRSWGGMKFSLPSDGSPQLSFRGWMTEPAVRRLCALAGKDLDALIASAHSRDFQPVPLGVRTSMSFDIEVQRTPTANVIGMLAGSDPALRDQAVVLTAHHDHLGVGNPDSTGDRIHNGAIDNASGCAQVLAIAQAFAATRPAPKRSVLCVFVAGEEQGLLGSEYYATHPTVPLAKIAMNLNIDGGNNLGRTSDVAVIGKGKSDLEDRLTTLARTLQKRTVVDEPEPDKGYYYRSDQLNFARVGVPAIYFKSGQTFIGRPAGWGKAMEADYRTKRYHQPGDQLTPSWDFTGMVEDAQLSYRLVLDVANDPKMPAWYKGDEFEAARKKTLEGTSANTH
jgi:hypothetical protein